MPNQVDWVSDDVWAEVVRYVPIPSVDLVVRCESGVLLAERQNEPAKGEWFVPGGRIRKVERLEEAIHRVSHEEIGVSVTVDRELGAYDHLYNKSDVDESGGKHYVAHGYVVTPDETDFVLDDQHADWEVFLLDNLPDLHPYVEAYLRDAGLLID